MRTAAVVPVHDGRGWLPDCLPALAANGFDLVVVVDDGSTDGTAAWLAAEHPEVVLATTGPGAPHGFAVSAQAGIVAAQDAEAIALVNADVVLRDGWLDVMLAALGSGPTIGSVAGKLVRRDDPGVIDDAGDVLRRDGVCEQRGRGRRDDGRWDAPGGVWGATAGAALYRCSALREAGGFWPGYRNYLEDVDLGLALRSLGWTCAYAPGAVGVHAGGGSAAGLPAPVRYWTARNTLVLVARWFPVRWWPLVAYRQGSWIVSAARDGVLGAHLRGVRDGLVAGSREWPGRRARRRRGRIGIAAAVPSRPWRGPAASGHPGAVE